jgi:hypothetical protein
MGVVRKCTSASEATELEKYLDGVSAGVRVRGKLKVDSVAESISVWSERWKIKEKEWLQLVVEDSL